MLKVFLVEDEMIVRNGIKNGIHWEEEGFAFVGEAADGELAYPLIKERKPDILITDIKMPFMDGIELSEQVHQIYPDMKIIILSGYGQFTYAQKAISIGVEEYLLKPISSVKMLEAVKKVAKVIYEERKNKQLLERYTIENNEKIERNKGRFFSKLMTKDMSVSQVLEQSRTYGIDLSAGAYSVVMFKLRKKGDEMGYSDHAVAALDAVKLYILHEEHVYYYESGIEGLVFLVTGVDTEQVKNKIQELCKSLDRIVSQDHTIEYFGSVGCVVTRLNELKKSYYNANKKYVMRFLSSWNQFALQDKMLYTGKIENDTAMETSSLVNMETRRELVEKFLKVGTIEETEDFISSYMDNIGENNMHSLMFRQYVAMDIYMSIIAFEEKLGIPENELMRNRRDINLIGQKIDSVEKTKQYIAELLKDIILKRDDKAGRKYTDLIEQAKIHINTHYMDEKMALNSVAHYVNMSPSYFSLIFGREVGQTFIEYLTQMRMDRARELLMCSSMKTSEIGYEVGYKDPHYFSYIFKKTQKCSPKEFRGRRKL